MKWLRLYGWRVYEQDSGGAEGSGGEPTVPEHNEYTVEDLEKDMLDDGTEPPAPEEGQPGEQTTDETPPAAPKGQPAAGAEGEGGVIPYTPEEMRNLDPTQIDRKRIPPEMMPFYDSMRSGFDRKMGEMTQKPPEQQLLQPPQGNLTPEQQLLQAYMQDADGVLRDIDAQIAKFEAEGDPFNVNRLTNMKFNLQNQAMRIRDHESRMDRIVSDTRSATLEAIPDFDNKVEELTHFAVNDLQIPMQIVQALTDPRIVGKDVVVAIRKAVNTAHARFTAGQTAVTKQHVDAPSGESPNPTPPAAASNTLAAKQAELKKAEAYAQKVGGEDAWAKVFELQSDVNAMKAGQPA